jgi:hypothetical protein
MERNFWSHFGRQPQIPQLRSSIRDEAKGLRHWKPSGNHFSNNFFGILFHLILKKGLHVAGKKAKKFRKYESLLKMCYLRYGGLASH